MTVRKPSPPPSGRVDRVRLLAWPQHLRPYCYLVGTIVGTVDDEVLVRFGEIVVQVPPELLEPTEE